MALGIQLLLDYPSGSLSDYLGQRWVLSIAYASLGISFILLSFASTIQDFIIAMIFTGIGRAQFSGTIETWLDNNYRILIENQDPFRKIFGFMVLRSRALFSASSAIAFFLGAYLATVTSREFAFQVQAVGFFFLIIITLFIVKNANQPLPDQIIHKSDKKTRDNYFIVMFKGIFYVITHKNVFFFIIGRTLLFSSFQFFLMLLYFPILFGYSGKDYIAGLVQSLSFITLIFSGFVVAYLTKKANTNKLPFYATFYTGAYFSGIILLIIFIPMTNTLNYLAILILLFLMIAIDGISGELAVNLLQRTSIDLIPSNIRNSIYSLSPSLVAILGLFLLPFIGGIVDFYGNIYAILVLEVIGLIGSLAFIFVFDYRKKNIVERKIGISF